MKNKWIIGLTVFGMLGTGSAGVYAGSKLEQIKAYLNHGLTIEVNGNPYTLKDGNGKKLVPITYGGLTYLPTRAIADALSVPVTYDPVTSKVKIGNYVVLKRPVNLPVDFPVAFDAVITKSEDKVINGIRTATIEYTTQETISTMGFVYKEYVRIKRISESTQQISDKSINITGLLGGVSPVMIQGKTSPTLKGYNNFVITWSETKGLE
ncbi:hypothetical protein [Paenibacillus sp. sgz500958]|uniref:hypothetical protein n=1 Tax=Paenibacillus sp. sgz500958 TaxID=3242475 RepID=UPI0036D40E60